ncbi:chromosome partition protein Smc [Planctomycetales bacterium]|nr:chromosome partition protein Smc [Planctomycetales bacterium]
MLKAIELSGFKSFADLTKLEFAEGICTIVGTNGSGKSNLIDAVKWVLGEQSMKKLRSSEATDIIFSGSAGRAPMGAAEVTLTFDNFNRTFVLETPEVHITRRIYRSGEGEYLINRQAARLKDIKDLLAGTGLGTQTYSIIEQGRVESLLQSSAVQRRVIFDEAAGISRFNARKQEIQRRHERVNQNLVRLGDKVGELEHQVKATRSQAGKAQLFNEYSGKLKELQIQAALTEYQRNAVDIIAIQQEVDKLMGNAEKVAADADKAESAAADKSRKIEALDQDIRQYEGELAAVRQRISGGHSTIELQFEQVAELEADIEQSGKQLLELKNRSTGIEDLRNKSAEDIAKAQDEYDAVLETYRQCTAISADSAKPEDTGKLEKQTKLNSGWGAELAAMQNKAAALEAMVQLKKTQLDEAKQRKSSRIKEYNKLMQRLSEAKQKQSGMKERSALLEELIRKKEGISPGVKEVLKQSNDTKSPFRYAFGMVGELLIANFESASLIESVALGAVSQHIVVLPKPELFQHIEQHAAEFSGRVGFIWLDPKEEETPWMKTFQFAGRKGVLGRADQFVQAEPQFQHLAKRLLGRIWIVQNIAVARQLYKESDDRTSFLTVNGEMLTPDGALIVGPVNNNAPGLMSRRSELSNLIGQLETLDKEILELEIEVGVAKDRVDSDEIDVENEMREYQDARTDYETQKHKCEVFVNIELATSEERLTSLKKQRKQYEDRLSEAQKMLTEQRCRSLELKERREATLLTILQMESALAVSYCEKELFNGKLASQYLLRNEVVKQRAKHQTEYKHLQNNAQKAQGEIYNQQSKRDLLLQEQDRLVKRGQEEFGVSIDGLQSESARAADTSPPLVDLQSTADEIAELRSKLQRLGNVNLEAVETLDKLEADYKKYSVYYNDIKRAKDIIEKEIENLNVESERIFAETFEGVRLHFQKTFQQLFGGGTADLVLDNPENVLESGIDIIAKPPGKDLKNIMLMSGGEKTMTCFALLLAFFRHKPNPVCILDECDAALDEGNIDRMNKAIKEFSKDTQFLMITHNKRSMVHAKTFYGITMQESGVSKYVSVRFEEVGENGEILTKSPKKAA